MNEPKKPVYEHLVLHGYYDHEGKKEKREKLADEKAKSQEGSKILRRKRSDRKKDCPQDDPSSTGLTTLATTSMLPLINTALSCFQAKEEQTRKGKARDLKGPKHRKSLMTFCYC